MSQNSEKSNDFEYNKDISENIGNEEDTLMFPLSHPEIPLITIHRLYKIFKQADLEVMALNDISMEIFRGEIVVIMGPSGSGKTTLLNCVAGLDNPSAGSIKITDLELTKLKDAQKKILLRDHIGIVFQQFNLIPSLTAYGNVEFPMLNARKQKKYRQQRCNALLEQVGLEERADHRPTELSGGECQRIAIAMALSNNPELILADEPTGNVDSISTIRILDIFREIVKLNPEKAIVIVTHNPIFRKIATRTFILRDGKIIKEITEEQNIQEAKDVDENYHLTDAEREQEFIDAIINPDSTHQKDEVAKILDPKNNFPEFHAIKECPNCGSRQLVKKYDENLSHIVNNYMVAPGIIVCRQCDYIINQEFAIFEIKKV